MTQEPEERVQGEIAVPAEEAAEARRELERVEHEGLVPVGERSLSYREAIELGHVLAASNYFKDATSAAQASVKVMVGAELGFGPMASIMGVHIVEGRPMIGGNLLGALLKRDPHFDYRLDFPEEVGRGDQGLPEKGSCEVTITLDGEDLTPVSRFSIDDARAAGLVKKNGNWDKWPRKMLYWRALSWAVDFHCPHLFGGVPLLTEGEVEEDGGNGDGGRLTEALNPSRPPALSDEKAERQRARMRELYDELRAMNPTLIVPGAFGNMVANAEHSHELLDARIAHLEDLVDVERQIDEAIAELRERVSEAELDKLLPKVAQARNRREALDKLKHALDHVPKGGGDDAERSSGE